MASPFSDRFQRDVTYVRLSVTDRCNYGCTYCMPARRAAFGSSEELLSFEEIERLVSVLAKVGVNRVRLTGGEPLLRKQLPLLVSKLNGIDGIDEVLLTTNAHALENSVAELADAGLAGVNISLDTIRSDRFERITRGGSLERTLIGLRAARRILRSVKTNTVAIRGFNDDEIVDLVRFATDEGVVPRFIEFMPIGENTIWTKDAWVPAATIREILAGEFSLEADEHQRGAGPARYWSLRGNGMPHTGAVVGIIAALTERFCDTCNRIRVTAQGGMRVCLADDREVDLRALIRSRADDSEILDIVQQALSLKRESHELREKGAITACKQMVKIGG